MPSSLVFSKDFEGSLPPIYPDAEATFNLEFTLDSGSLLPYVAPQKFSKILCESNDEEAGGGGETSQWMSNPRRKLSTAKGADGIVDMERWEGVLDFCRALDNAVEIELETGMFADKCVLEFGFATGLPSAFAYRNGAASVCVHCWDESQLNSCVKPTVHRNNIPRNICKFSAGDAREFTRTMPDQKFDVILAPELLCTDEAEFAQLHDLLENLINPGGIILISARPHYSECSGNLPAFLDLLKMKGHFDGHIRWTSAKSDNAPRKLIQLTEAIR